VETGPAEPTGRRPAGGSGRPDELDTLLEDYHYSPHARAQIVAYTAREGMPTGCAYLDREDEQDTSEVFVAELEPVPLDHESWDRPDVMLDAELLAEGTHPFPVAPISGGCGEPAPFEPSEADWQDYRQHLDQVECLYGYE
jgi:hypothetical protein